VPPPQPEDIVSEKVVFEHPLNERIRTFLRLEHLFERITHFLPQPDAWSTRAAVEGLLDILGITARADIKTEILKELDRHTAVLERIGQQPGVDTRTLSRVLEDLEVVTEKVYRMEGQIASTLRENEFMKTIIQRSSIPGGTCSFDLPQYHHWLTQPHPTRQRRVQAWIRDMVPIREAITLLLSLARGSNEPKPATANSGFYQGTLNAQAPVQMIRIELAQDMSLFPEISGHKHRFSIRFLEAVDTLRPAQTDRDVEFRLTSCVF
jgi:cell division protein ZapD